VGGDRQLAERREATDQRIPLIDRGTSDGKPEAPEVLIDAGFVPNGVDELAVLQDPSGPFTLQPWGVLQTKGPTFNRRLAFQRPRRLAQTLWAWASVLALVLPLSRHPEPWPKRCPLDRVWQGEPPRLGSAG